MKPQVQIPIPPKKKKFFFDSFLYLQFPFPEGKSTLMEKEELRGRGALVCQIHKFTVLLQFPDFLP
jgi:hypothetical protein